MNEPSRGCPCLCAVFYNQDVSLSIILINFGLKPELKINMAHGKSTSACNYLQTFTFTYYYIRHAQHRLA